MTAFEGIKILFVAGFGPVVTDQRAARKLYADTLGVQFTEEKGGYLHTEKVEGVKTFALWPLAQAAASCFGADEWPKNLPIPQAWLEFDVEDMRAATEVLKKRGYKLLVALREEPWGQTVTRFLSPEGLLVGITHTPSMRE
jgi:catechol 2,3-dioxygenase-like lactoylglutathione lyase family enzyme